MSADHSSRTVRIATRHSPLALWQANHLAELLRQCDPERSVELVPVSTIGDRDRVEPLRAMGGQGVFTREVQRAVLDHEADIAVHSLKDLPTVPVEGLELAGIPKRGPRFDALVFAIDTEITKLSDLPAEARIGTGSPRRQSQLLSARPDLVLAEIRGNVETRLKKLDDGEFDAIVLAQAGLERLGLGGRVNHILMPPLMFPAVGQAAIGVECRQNDEHMLEILNSITDQQTFRETICERACLFELQAGCHAPVGVHAQVEGDVLTLDAVVLSADGKQKFSASVTGPVSDPRSIGKKTAENLIEQGAASLL